MIDLLPFQNVCGQTAAGHLLLAKERFEAGCINAALVEIDRAIDHSPQFGKAYFWKGIMLYLLARHDQAKASLERSLQLNPDEANGWFVLAILQFEGGQSILALDSVQRSLALDAHNPRVHHLRGSIALAVGNLAEAVSADRLVLQLSPGFSQSRLRLASTLQRFGNETAAIDETLACLRMHSTDVNTRICLANLLLDLGRIDDAIAECRATALLFPQSPHPLLRLAQIYADLEDDDAAIAAAQEAIRRVPKHLECEMLLGRISLKRGDTEAAIIHAKAALAIDAQLFEAQELIKASEDAASHA